MTTTCTATHTSIVQRAAALPIVSPPSQQTGQGEQEQLWCWAITACMGETPVTARIIELLPDWGLPMSNTSVAGNCCGAVVRTSANAVVFPSNQRPTLQIGKQWFNVGFHPTDHHHSWGIHDKLRPVGHGHPQHLGNALLIMARQ